MESCELDLALPESIEMDAAVPDDVMVFDGFTEYSEAELKAFKEAQGFAMGMGDILSCQDYFKNSEHRNPTITEMMAIDTYWSDHCRHTTFLTRLENIAFDESAKNIEKVYSEYQKSR